MNSWVVHLAKHLLKSHKHSHKVQRKQWNTNTVLLSLKNCLSGSLSSWEKYHLSLSRWGSCYTWWAHIKKNPKTKKQNPETPPHTHTQNQKQSREGIYLVSPSALAMWPNIWAKELGMMPLSSGTARTPSMVKVLPVPVCPYAKIVPGG